MASWASILLEPLTPPLYRWKGEFSPQTRGPQAYAESKPVPLPSTIAGLLAGQFSAALKCGSAEVNLENVLEEHLGSGFKLRGPYIYAELVRDGGDKASRIRIICTILGAEKLYCIDVDDPNKTAETGITAVQHIGIAIDSLSKSVIRGYMYTVRMADIYTTIAKLAKETQSNISIRLEKFGILIEVYGDTSQLGMLNGRVVWVGSRQKPYHIHLLDEAPARTLAAKAAGKEVTLHLVSPILLCSDNKINYGIEARLEEKLYSQLLGKIAAKPFREPSKRVCGRLVFTALGRGYDLCLQRKRPYCQAVMPGAQLRIELARNPLDLYDEGVGSYRRLGWGTILPLPSTLWACEEDQN